MSSLRYVEARWLSTVRTETTSASAMSRSVIPRAARRATSSSRRVSGDDTTGVGSPSRELAPQLGGERSGPVEHARRTTVAGGHDRELGKAQRRAGQPARGVGVGGLQQLRGSPGRQGPDRQGAGGGEGALERRPDGVQPLGRLACGAVPRGSPRKATAETIPPARCATSAASNASETASGRPCDAATAPSAHGASPGRWPTGREACSHDLLRVGGLPARRQRDREAGGRLGAEQALALELLGDRLA